MYTAILNQTYKNQLTHRRIVIIDVTDGRSTFSKEFSFSLTATEDDIKRTVKSYLDELNAPDVVLSGAIDGYVPPVESTKTKAELNREAWVKDWQNLQAAKKLEAHGVSVLTASQMTALQTKVKTTFKNEYVDSV